VAASRQSTRNTKRLRMSKVAVGPMTEEASGIRRFGDIADFEDGLRALVEG
jgi:hypothetical protein